MQKISFKNDVLPLKDKLFRLALRITLNPAEAEDTVQDTLIKVWERREEWPQITNIEAYSMTICRHLALDIAGKAGHGNVQLPEELNDKVTTSPAERMDWQERLSMVKQLMDSLPEVQRSIMQLRDIEGKTYQEIAEIMQLSESQVKVYLHRARTKVRQQTEEQERYGL